MTNKVLITGIDSFTGKYLACYLKKNSFDVYGTSLFTSDDTVYQCDITKKEQIIDVLRNVEPDYFIHLSGISFVAHSNNEDFYRVNVVGTNNILDAFLEIGLNPKKVILASSATVYGNQGLEVLDESLCPKPVNHYGISKYAMEALATGYFDKLPIIITRPFNYTGIGQSDSFLIPKIVKHFKNKKEVIELGNIDVIREFNDINFVCEVYKKLLEIENSSEVVNICSGRGIKILDVIRMMSTISGYNIKVEKNPKFIRKNEIKKLIGSNKKLFKLIGTVNQCDFYETLVKMYEA